jgi:hypothetical protein
MATSRSNDDSERALTDALSAVLRPLARLAVARGVPCATAEDLLRRAFVLAAREAQPEPSAARIVSRISTATGLTRRQVTPLLANEAAPPVRQRSLAAELFAHWTTSRTFRDRRGGPKVLPRQGKGVTFETLAQSITRDVHPRSLLDELVRLGLATHDVEKDTLALRRDRFVPTGDMARLLAFLGDNVGDHLNAAVDNVLAEQPRHFEQAMFAHEVSARAVKAARDAIRTQWQALIDHMVPMLEGLIETDSAQGRARNHRLRVGLFSHDEAAAGVPTPGSALPASARAPGTAGKGRPRKEST